MSRTPASNTPNTVTHHPATLDQTGCSGLIGILGGGQLGRMLGMAGLPLGLRFRFWDPEPSACAGAVGELVQSDFNGDSQLRDEAIARFVPWLDVVTSEFENVPAALLDRIAEGRSAAAASKPTRVYPPASAFRICQDRLLEKECFNRVGLQTPRFAAVGSVAELEAVIDRIGLPCVLKTRRMGYDGKGQAVIRSHSQIASAFAEVAGHVQTPELIVESFVEFQREVSLICVRSSTGQTRFYPLVENHHSGGILRLTIAPAPDLLPELTQQAEAVGQRLLDELGYIGVLAIEMFVVGRGHDARLLGNEMAPRVHNSGHWTIEGSHASQFENHLRAILGWPLGDTDMREGVACAAMLNLIGGPLPDPSRLQREPWMHLHLYNKAARPGRKIGHITITAPSRGEMESRIATIRGCFGLA